jgi:hypothetical protein
MEITIILEGVVRNFVVDKVDLLAKDWNEVMEDMLDTVEKADLA